MAEGEVPNPEERSLLGDEYAEAATRSPSNVGTIALWVFFGLLIGVFGYWTMTACQSPSAAPTEQDQPTASQWKAWAKDRVSDAQILSRSYERQERQDLRQERREKRQERREARQEAREQEQAAEVVVSAPEPPQSSSGGLPGPLLMVRAHESGGNYRAYNASGCVGGCYGAFQMSGAYMGTWAVRAGYPEYNYAGFWPPEVQNAVALHMYNQPNGLYVYWCKWASYC